MCNTVLWKYLNGAADNTANIVMTFAFVFFVFVNSTREKNLSTCQQRWIGAEGDIAARDTVDVVSGERWVCIFLFFRFLPCTCILLFTIVFTPFFGFARHWSSSSTSRIFFLSIIISSIDCFAFYVITLSFESTVR